MSYYPARAVVDLAAIRANVARLREYAATAQVMAVVKADAYGHGLVPVARAAREAGAAWLGVAQLSEALALRAAGDTGRVLAWLYGPGAPLAECVAAEIDLSVPAPWALAEVREAAAAVGRPARVHLKIDTGMGRSGQLLPAWTEMLHEAVEAQRDGLVRVVGVFSHLARADEVDHPSVRTQFDVFAEAVRRAEEAGADLEVRHLANSAATLTEPAVHYDLVRPGLATYGLSPLPGREPAQLGLRPAMRVESQLVVVKDVPAGQGVSYGHTYTTRSDTRLAVVPLGYGDGVPRHASNAAEVQVGGHRFRIAGRVCMDQLVLDVGGTSAAEGDRVVLFGPGDDGEPTAQDWADAVGTINYEIVTRLGARVPREYVG
ncbi:MAG TPA: alanine racemase [Actinotalea caeni]|uniref:alanine racemase n=1 Tax=Actinotalea caeni TaxID=1348467 RepID=UPI002B4AD095|nr:alanine racemase [Actinotalea caeni]HLV54165.1 alanine racemase [Actinotalea caeni]